MQRIVFYEFFTIFFTTKSGDFVVKNKTAHFLADSVRFIKKSLDKLQDFAKLRMYPEEGHTNTNQ